jgi:membrane-bound lytic murein transglycosylase B
MYQNKKCSFLDRFFIFLLLSGVVFFISGVFRLSAQTTVSSSAVAERQAALQAQLDDVEKQIAAQQVVLDQTQKEGSSIQRDIAILDAKIAEAKLKIQKANINIQQLGQDINTKSQTINVLSGKIDENQQSLGQLIKKTNEIDTTSLAEIMLSNQAISEFFNDSDSIDVIKSSLYDVYQQTKSNREVTQVQKDALAVRKNAEEDARQVIVTEQKNIQADETQKQKLLSLNKTEQKQYQQVIDSQKKRAAAIRSALFALRDSAAIPFGTALDYANFASKQTGVRPAFILAILTQESNLGENVGACYLRDYTTGSGVGVTSGAAKSRVMSPSRDIQPFLTITSALGLDPQNMRVSCWMTAYSGGQPTGWGGAMGPSQFIPSTWQIYAPKLSTLLGIAVPNPWDPKAAIMATAYYLENLGADAQTFTSERTAALKYYAGSNWSKAANAFYGDQVMAKAQSVQHDMIDPLQNS